MYRKYMLPYHPPLSQRDEHAPPSQRTLTRLEYRDSRVYLGVDLEENSGSLIRSSYVKIDGAIERA